LLIFWKILLAFELYGLRFPAYSLWFATCKDLNKIRCTICCYSHAWFYEAIFIGYWALAIGYLFILYYLQENWYLTSVFFYSHFNKWALSRPSTKLQRLRFLCRFLIVSGWAFITFSSSNVSKHYTKSSRLDCSPAPHNTLGPW